MLYLAIDQHRKQLTVNLRLVPGTHYLVSSGDTLLISSVADHRQERGDLDQLVNLSSRPDRCAFALLQGHCRACFANFARTGFSSTYRAAASKYGSSMTNKANRPCHKQPRHFSRKLMRRV